MGPNHQFRQKRPATLEFAHEINAYGQNPINEAVMVLARPSASLEMASLAEVAVAVTGIGDIESKISEEPAKDLSAR